MEIFSKNLRADLLKINDSQVHKGFSSSIFTIICKSCQHNLYLESIKMSLSIIGKKLGNAKK